MLRVISVIILICLWDISYCQKKDISLYNLSKLVFSKADSLDTALSPYSYRFEGVDTFTLNGTKYTDLIFIRNNFLEKSAERLTFTKIHEPLKPGFEIFYSSQEDMIVNKYKVELKSNKSHQYLYQDFEGDCVKSFYRLNSCDYTFYACGSVGKGNKVSMVRIKFNNFIKYLKYKRE